MRYFQIYYVWSCRGVLSFGDIEWESKSGGYPAKPDIERYIISEQKHPGSVSVLNIIEYKNKQDFNNYNLFR